MSINFGGGSSKQKSQVTLPPRTAEETELLDVQRQVAQIQLRQLQQGEADAAAEAASPLRKTQTRVEELATQQLLDRLEGRAPVLPEAAAKRIGQRFDLAQRRGSESLKTFSEELAGMRGMRPTDSPIGGDVLRQQRELTEGLESARAGSELDFGQTEALFAQSLSNFQNQLRQQAFQNRLAMAGVNAAPGALGTMQNLFGQRLAAAPQMQRGSWNQWQAGISGKDVGGLMMGAGALGMCHVAWILYGPSEDFWSAWYWINHGWQGRWARCTRAAYRRLSRPLARVIHAAPWVGGVIRPLFNVAVRHGRDALDA